jgi:hypothetical protein
VRDDRENHDRKKRLVVIQHGEVRYWHHVGKGSKLIRLFAVTVFLELNFTRLLDKVANMAAACSKEIGATVTRDVVSATSVASLNCLRNG